MEIRWNWLLRIKVGFSCLTSTQEMTRCQNHSRRFPCLLPPPEFKDTELAQMGLTGTCELQICRSAGPWSLGTLGHVEQSIQNAYVQGECSWYTRHHHRPRFSNSRLRTFRIYREPILHHVVSNHIRHNSTIAFIPSRTIINETRVENKIGDALFHRIMRAHKDNQAWKCCIVIPLLPGFTFPVDHTDASAVSLVLTAPSTIVLSGDSFVLF